MLFVAWRQHLIFNKCDFLKQHLEKLETDYEEQGIYMLKLACINKYKQWQLGVKASI